MAGAVHEGYLRLPNPVRPNRRPMLELSPDEMRALGYRAVDMMVSHLAALPDEPVFGTAARAEMEARLREPPPAEGRGWEAVLQRVGDEVFRPMTHLTHPRFFAYVPGPSNFIGAIADALASGFNPFAGAWAMSPAAAQVELVTADWLREALGMPSTAGGLFVSGGSMATLTALAVARHKRLGDDASRGVIYCSNQTHTAVDRGARILGFRPDQLRKLAPDEHYRLRVDDLAAAMDADAAAGLRPFCVVANAGTTSTGAVDPLAEIADLCRARGVWMHVDGAYGGAAVLTDEGRAILHGIGEADSIALDAHKWLFQPVECGCVLVRQAEDLKDTFRMVPAYLRDNDLSAEEVNFRDWGVQLTRGFRALKLWMTIQVFGMHAMRAAVGRGMRLAEVAEEELRALADWEIVTPAQLGIVTFRHRPNGIDGAEADDLQRRIATGLAADGYALLSTTELRGRTVLRLCTINPRTTDEEMRRTVRTLDRIARERVDSPPHAG
ncbi:pyridoxal phosphate-dependent decarboxylase family protein [Longimicrobium sp.]|uniref:pyridoxal phosphate-dependent decarboxylase family protein n=1 Tax=Longimicrobium sp. TaxID=2029185 RepID=UPI002F93C706